MKGTLVILTSEKKDLEGISKDCFIVQFHCTFIVPKTNGEGGGGGGPSKYILFLTFQDYFHSFRCCSPVARFDFIITLDGAPDSWEHCDFG